MESLSRRKFTCGICLQPILLLNKRFKNKRGCCVHQFCTDCVVKYIAVKLDNNIGDIPCPALNCKQFLDPTSCRNLVGPQLFVRWCDVLCESAISGLVQCYCPNRNCSALILDECGGNAKQSQCPKCKKFFCFQCRSPWHAGVHCDENQDSWDRNDVAFVSLAERKEWKRCPNCRCFVERIDGCKFVVCRCGGNFCYNCRRQLKGYEICYCVVSDDRDISFCRCFLYSFILIFVVIALLVVLFWFVFQKL